MAWACWERRWLIESWQAGATVFGFDVNHERRQEALDLGVRVTASTEAALNSATVCILSLPNSEVVDRVLSELIEQDSNVRTVTTIVDTTTGTPKQMASFASRLSPLGIQYVEACVAGSSEQLRCGQASLLLGGEACTAS